MAANEHIVPLEKGVNIEQERQIWGSRVSHAEEASQDISIVVFS